MNREYYQNYYHLERNHWWFVVRLEILRQELRKIILSEPLNSKRKILNIGIATGKTSEMLQEFGQVVSLEYDALCADFVRERVGIEVIEGSVLELPFRSEEFDWVCAFDVIEHVEDDQKAVSQLKRVCKVKGQLCITVPAFQSLWSYHDEVNQHFGRYTKKRIRKLFDFQSDKSILNQNQSLKVLRQSYFNAILFVPIWVFRKIIAFIPQKQLRKGAGSDFEIYKKNKLLDNLFKGLFRVEKMLLQRGCSFPFGVSFLFFLEKQS